MGISEGLSRMSWKLSRTVLRGGVPGNGGSLLGSSADGTKQPWYISGFEDRPLSLAGLWEHWQSPDGSLVETCAIITTTANELVAPIHDRMPVILPPGSIVSWLELNTKQDEVKNLLRPCAPEMLAAYTVSNLVNNPKFDSPACIARV